MNSEVIIINGSKGVKKSRSKHKRKASSKRSRQTSHPIINVATNNYCHSNFFSQFSLDTTEESIFDPQIDDKENISNFSLGDHDFLINGKSSRNSNRPINS